MATATPSLLRRLSKEPLLHFLLLGALLFAVYGLMSGPSGSARDEILITAGRIENLAAIYEKTWQRAPTRKELQGLVNDFLREEVTYREGLAMGLDQDDTIIRRRMRQKFEFIVDGQAEAFEPTEEDLQVYLEQQVDDFRLEPRYTFQQVYLNPNNYGTNVVAKSKDIIQQASEPGADLSLLGNRSMLQSAVKDRSASDVDRLFGRGFAAALAEQPIGQWCGPLSSGYGLHVVMIDTVTPGRIPALEEVRKTVHREWLNQERTKLRETFYDALQSKYTVTIEWPE